MPCAFTSPASASLSASNANFEAQYADCPADVLRPATDVTLTMQPARAARIEGRTAWRQRMAPK